MAMFTYGQSVPVPEAGNNSSPTSGDRLRGIFRCTLTEELVRQNVDFCLDFIEKQILDRSQRSHKIPILLVSCLLLVVGLVGNVLVILSVVVFPGMRSRTNLFLMNLALSDVLIFLICLPLTIYNLVQLRWIFGSALCKLTPFLQGLSISVSVWSLASLSVNRFVIVRYPLEAKEALTNWRMGLWLAGIWLLSLLVCSPTPMVYVLREERLFWLVSVHSCVEDWYNSPRRKIAYTGFVFCMLYLLPLLGMSVFSWKLSRRLVNTARFSAQFTQPNQAVSRGRVKASKVVMALLIAFAACWLPYHVVNILIDLRHNSQPATLNATVFHGVNGTSAVDSTDDNQLVTTMLPVALLLGYASSAINPVCLAIISSRFKACFISLVTLRCRVERHTLVAADPVDGGRHCASLQERTRSRQRCDPAADEGIPASSPHEAEPLRGAESRPPTSINQMDRQAHCSY